MADEVLGSAYVIIRALTNKIKDDIQEGVKRGARDADLESAGKEIGGEIGESAGDEASLKLTDKLKRTPDDNRHDFDIAGQKIGDAIGEGLLGSGSIKNVGRRIADVFRRDRSAERGGSNYGARIGRRIGKGIGDAIKRIPLLPFIAAMLIPALGGALKILSAYVGAATALISNLGPVVAGSAVAGIATYATLGQTIGAVTLALKTQSPLLDSFKRDMEDIGERFQSIGRSVQEALLPRLSRNIERIADSLLPSLRRGLTETGSVVAGISRRFATLAENPVFKRSFGNVLDNNNELLGKLGRAVANLVGALVHVLGAARPVIRVFGDWALRMSQAANHAARLGAKTGSLRDFFQRAADSMRQWGRILGNFGTGLWNILKIAKPFGDILANRIERISGAFRRFTESAGGENKIRLFFKNSLPIVRAFNRLLGEAFKLLFGGLAKPGAAKGTVEFLNALRTDLLPALAVLARQLARMGPHLIDLFVAFADVLTRMAKSGALGAFTTTLTKILDIFAKILDLPVIGTFAGFALALAGIGKALNLATFGAFGKMLGGIGAIVGRFIGKISVIVGLMGGWGAVIRMLIGGLIRLGAAFLVAIGPVGWVIIAVVALGAALVLLWKKSETFRNIVIGVWNAIKKASVAVWNAIKGALVAAWNGIKTAISAGINFIKGVITGGLRVIKSIWNAIWKTFGPLVKAVVGLIVAIIKLWWAVVSGLFRTAKLVLTTIFKAIWTAIVTVVRTATNIVKSVISTVWNAIKSVTSTVWNAIKGVLTAVWDSIKGYVMPAVNAIKDTVTGAWDTVKSKTSEIWNGIKSAVSDAIDAVVETVSGLKDKVVDFFSGAATWLLDAGKNLIGGLIDGITSRIGEITDKISGAAQAVKDFFPGSPIRRGPLTSWNRGAAGKRLIDALAAGMSDTRPLDRAARAMAGRIDARIGSISPAVLASQGTFAGGGSAGAVAAPTPPKPAPNISVVVHNPIAERTSDSIQHRLMTIAQLGLLELGPEGG